MVLARSLNGTIAISIEAPVDLQLKFGVRMNLVRHGNFFSERSSQKTSFAQFKSDQKRRKTVFDLTISRLIV
jgi:hypothetical protein